MTQIRSLTDISCLSWMHEDIVESYGGKAANIGRLMRLGANVPHGFAIGVSGSIDYLSQRSAEDVKFYMHEITQRTRDHVTQLEAETGRKFGAATKANFPLLVSVRSGAPVSMPGMMDTVLNVGLNDKSVRVLGLYTNPEFAWDSYRRFVQSYAKTVLGIDAKPFEELVSTAESFCAGGILTEKMNQFLVVKFISMCGGRFPQNVYEQLSECIEAVFRSWNSERAIAYRNVEKIGHFTGTAVTVQSMVYGNLNKNSGTGVLFTRNPVSGDNEFYGDFLINAQGEDVVDGSHQTQPIAEMARVFPEAWAELKGLSSKLELSLQDMCDIEFTVEDGKLWLLQVRKGKRSAKASRMIPLHFLKEGWLDVKSAYNMIPFGEVDVLDKHLDVDGFTKLGSGHVACEGDIEGIVALNSITAMAYAAEGKDVILVSEKTSPEDMPGIIASKGIVTFTGGLVSHAAVVARSWNKPCVVGIGKSIVDGWYFFNDSIEAGDKVVLKNGDSIIIKASESGTIYIKRAS